MKIGKFVKRHIPAIFEYCEVQNPSEFTRLQDPRYSKKTFDINYAFCRPVETIGQTDHIRYWQDVYTVLGVPIRVTSQWFNPPTSNSLQLFRKFLTKQGIHFDDSEGIATDSCENTSLAVERRARGRYRMHAIGNGQNAVIRFILGQLGDEQFNSADWNQVIASFGNCCAYCGKQGELVMDHIVPINKRSLGEHQLGNLVPACRNCNATKGSKELQDFLANDPTRVRAIVAHMENCGYTPLGDHDEIRKILDIAHTEVRQLADRYVEIIETVLQEDWDGA